MQPEPKSYWRIALQILRSICYAVAALNSLAFTSWVWEECLQTEGFAMRTAIDAGDATLARAAIVQFSDTMHMARAWHKWCAWPAFLTHAAYSRYFNDTASLQLAAAYERGVVVGLWPEAVDRYTITRRIDGTKIAWDSWTIDTAIPKALKQIDEGMPGTCYTPELGWHPSSIHELKTTIKTERKH